jgi:GH25 family lysozyme M1 (1,4-beta-N-acetylmuramidase)
VAIKGTDIASHQGPDFPFATLKAQGYEFTVIKASGGHGYRNPYRAAQVQAARAAGVEVGFYHYMFEPSSGGGDVDREVTNFIDAVRPHVQPGTTFWLDVEEYPGAVGFTGDLGGWIDTFCARVSQEFNCQCGIYCATWYLTPTKLNKDQRLAKYPFWMASWQDALPPKAAMAPWTSVTIWQYNADGFDKDMFMGGGVAELRALGAGAAQPPAFQHAEGWLDPIVDTFEWGGAGIIVARTVVAYNDEEHKWYSREWHAETGYTPWVELTP